MHELRNGLKLKKIEYTKTPYGKFITFILAKALLLVFASSQRPYPEAVVPLLTF